MVHDIGTILLIINRMVHYLDAILLFLVIKKQNDINIMNHSVFQNSVYFNRMGPCFDAILLDFYLNKLGTMQLLNIYTVQKLVSVIFLLTESS